MNKNKIIFWALWLGLLALVPVTVLSNTSFQVAVRYPAILANFIQRVLGLTLFTLIFWQIMLGTFMPRLIEKLGGWIFKFHITEGITIYLLAILHPVFFLLYRYFLGKGLDPFYIFTQVCVLCKTQQELYYTLGRVSFWLINVTVFAGLFRAATPFMQMHWRKFHVLNYLVFLLVGIHGLSIGTDFMTQPFFTFAILSYLIVLYMVVFKKLPELFRNLRLWLS